MPCSVRPPAAPWMLTSMPTSLPAARTISGRSSEPPAGAGKLDSVKGAGRPVKFSAALSVQLSPCRSSTASP